MPISNAQRQDIVGAAQDLLREAADLTSGRDPNYIRDAMPGNIIDQVALAAARQGCRRYADKGSTGTQARRTRLERACRPYLDSIDPASGPIIAPPFRGGQCPVNYTVRADRYSLLTGALSQAGQVLTGSILGPLSFAANPSSPPPGGCPVGGGEYDPGSRIVGAGGVILSLSGSGCSSFHPQFRNVQVTRNTAGADNCGTLPPDIVGPRPDPTPTGPGPIRFNPGPSVDVDISVEVNIDGTLTINVGTGPVTIDPFADPAPTGGGGGDPGDPTDPGSPGGGGSTGTGGEEDGMAPPGQEIVGLLVTVTTAPGDANRFDNNSKQPFRGIGYVRMGYPGRLGLDISGGTVISPQFFHAPQRGLTNWAVSANIGFNLTIVPYYRSIEL